MMPSVRTVPGVAILLTLFATPPATALQEAPADTRVTVAGRVVNALSAEAVRRAAVTLSPLRGKGKEVNATTDQDGRFTLRAEPGAYRLSGERPGFRKQQFGARLNPDAGAVLGVAAGQNIADLLFKLAPDAVISGSVLNQEGEPVPSLIVTTLRNGYQSGKRQWVTVGSSQTNDRGEYRIAGLRAGNYRVMVTEMNIGIALAATSAKSASPDKPEAAYASTWLGNTPDPERAAVIDLKMGDDRRGANIQMQKARTVSVKGKVVDYRENLVMLVMLVRRGEGDRDPGRFALVQPEGLFDIRGVVPGSYLLTSRSVSDPTKAAGAMPVEVADQPIEGLQFRMGAAAEVSGRVISEQPAKDLEVALGSTDFDTGTSPSAHPGADGSFSMSGILPVTYRLRVTGLPEDGYLKSVKVDGREADEANLSLTAGNQLEIALGARGAVIEGTVNAAGGKPLAGAVVTLIPESGRDSRYRSATADDKGSYKISGIAPGKYRLLAWEDLEPGAYRDPAFVKPFEAAAQAVSVQEGGASKIALEAVPLEKLVK
jgi:protocatechuate 3,4-dioxygenase beta subunit